MKKILPQLLACLLLACLLNSCKKGFTDQQSSPPNQQQPDLATQARMTVSGFVTNENGQAVYNALVTAGTATARTDNDGYFKFTNILLSKTAPFISVTQQGYFESYRTFVNKENTENIARIKLVPKTNAGTINAASGGSATTTDGGTVNLPANAIVNASTNIAYTGTVHVAAHVFKQDDATEFAATAPGDNRGINSDGYLQLRKSYGMMAVELTGDAGEKLQIAPGKEATITTPIPAALSATAPASIPLWSFDATKGLWKQEGSTTKSGNNYVGNVSHFSFWDGATGLPLVNFTAQIVNNSLQTLADVFVVITRADDPTVGTSALTNNNGIVSGAVPANTSLVLHVYNICGSPVEVLSQNFTTTNNDIDLGTITANLNDQVTITGTAVDCNNAPITNGSVLMYMTNANAPNSVRTYKTAITNGSFSFSTVSCPDMNMTYVAVDNNANQQGYSQVRTLAAGSNNLGQLTACGISTLGFINYNIDGGPFYMVTEPADTVIATYNYDSVTGNGEGHIMKLGNFDNPRGMIQIQYRGLNTVGGDHTVFDIWSNHFAGVSMRARVLVPIPLTITEFGNRGEFIAGSFSGSFENWDDGSPHTISCTFRVRRLN